MSFKHHEIFEVCPQRNIVDSTCHTTSNNKSWPDNCFERFAVQRRVGNKRTFKPRYYGTGALGSTLMPNVRLGILLKTSAK